MSEIASTTKWFEKAGQMTEGWSKPRMYTFIHPTLKDRE